MYPIIGHIGSLTIYTYGLMYALGLSFGFYFVNRWAKESGFDEDDVLNLFIILILTTVGGARLTYVLSYPEHFADWTDAFRLWKGGLTIMGGGFLTIACFIGYCRYYKLNMGLAFDLFYGAFPVGIFFGRLGCFGYGCCYGTASSLPWAVTFPKVIPAIPRHPTQLYTSIIMVFIFLAILWYRRRPHVDGMITIFFVYLYCLYRFLIEFIRADTANEHYLFGLTQAQSFSIMSVLIALSIQMIWLRQKPEKKEESK